VTETPSAAASASTPAGDPRSDSRRASPIAEEVRRRRKALGLTLREAATHTKVSYTVISQVENGVRVPSPRTYQKLRAGLGLEALPHVLLPPRPPAGLMDEHLSRLAACVILQRRGRLASLADALGIEIPAVREGLLHIADRLAAVGLRAVEDGAEVYLAPLPDAGEAAATLEKVVEPVAEVTPEQFEVLAVVALLGTPSRRQVEEFRRHQESAGLLGRLIERGLLEKGKDDAAPGKPYVYRVTPAALAALGQPSIEALRASLTQRLDRGEE
jgi:chromosome segregation and condensation protein ScpB